MYVCLFAQLSSLTPDEEVRCKQKRELKISGQLYFRDKNLQLVTVHMNFTLETQLYNFKMISD